MTDPPSLNNSEIEELTMNESKMEEIEEETSIRDDLREEYGIDINTLLEEEKPVQILLNAIADTTLMQSPLYNSKEELMCEDNPHSLIYWGKTISNFAKRIKPCFLSNETLDLENNIDSTKEEKLLSIFINLHAAGINRFLIAASLDPLNSFENTAPFSSVKRGGSKFPRMELCYEWGIASSRYGKLLNYSKECHAAFIQLENAANLLIRVIKEEKRRKWTLKSIDKIIPVLKQMAHIKPTSLEVQEYCDVFLVQFSNLAMKGDVKDLSIDPLITMAQSDCMAIRESHPIEVLKHLTTYFKNNISPDSSEKLEKLEKEFDDSSKKNVLDHLTTSEKVRIKASNIAKEDYFVHMDTLLNILRWNGSPKCRLSFDCRKIVEIDMKKWKQEDPSLVFSHKRKIVSTKDRAGQLYIALRKEDRVPVLLKTFCNWEEHKKSVLKEIAFHMFMSNNINCTKLLDVYQNHKEVWAVIEYCDAGNLLDLIPIAPLTEPEMAYITTHILRALDYLHQNDKMHRNLTTSSILLNTTGDVLVSDFEMWIGRNLQRFWLPPETLQPSPKPYGKPVDIWCLGCILLEMANGAVPYKNLHPVKELFLTATVGLPLLEGRKWSNEFKDFVENCIRMEPSQRSTARELLEDPWLKTALSRKEFAATVPGRMFYTR